MFLQFLVQSILFPFTYSSNLISKETTLLHRMNTRPPAVTHFFCHYGRPYCLYFIHKLKLWFSSKHKRENLHFWLSQSPVRQSVAILSESRLHTWKPAGTAFIWCTTQDRIWHMLKERECSSTLRWGIRMADNSPFLRFKFWRGIPGDQEEGSHWVHVAQG